MKLKKILVGTTLVVSAFAVVSLVAQRHSTLEAAAQSGECTTVKPGPDWVCVGGGWYPPGMPLPGGESSATPAPSTGCPTVKPGPGWVCAGGGWYPPGMPLPGGASRAASAPSVPSIGCTTVKPGPDWVCAGGGWYPPGMTPPGGMPRVASSSGSTSGATSTSTSASSSTTARSGSAAATSSTGGRLRVMTWNIHFGHGNTWGQAREIANSGADVVLLQEASTFNEYMPGTYPEKLRQLTGQQWYSVWAPHGGRYSDKEGTLILSRLPLVGRSTMNSTERGFSRAVVNVGGVNVTILNAHLDWNSGMRSSQLEAFLDWGRQVGGLRLAGGDFNSWWGEWWIKQMENDYSDTWQDVTGSDENGYTLNRSVRFDYLFRSYDDHWRLIPTGCWVRWTNLSDHGAVVADYTVR